MRNSSIKIQRIKKAKLQIITIKIAHKKINIYDIYPIIYRNKTGEK